MKAAVVGLGRMGRRHVLALRALGMDLVGGADPFADSIEATVKELAVPRDRLFRDAKELLAATKPDVLVIATTAPAHAPLTIDAAAAGVKYILCEKPMASSLAECDEMLAACKRHGARLAINHQMRFMEQYLEAKKLIEAPDFGGWASINVIAGNFGIAMNGTHYFELLRWLSGSSIETVTAWFAKEPIPSPRGPAFFDRAGQLRLTTENGKRMYMDIGDDQGHQLCVVYAGRAGMLVADELGGTIDHAVRAPEHRDLPTTRYGMPGPKQRITVAPADAVVPTQRVLEALVAERDYPSGEDGRTSLETLVAAYISSEGGGRTVRIRSNELPRDRRFDYA
jgi:predicted dehydrogenase